MPIVGVIPAAGRAERLQPLASSKETLDVGGRPVMEYVLERMRAVEPAEIRVVTRRDKQDVVACARRAESRVVFGNPPTPAASILLGLEGLDAADRVLVGFPDTIWEPADGFARLVRALDEADVLLGAFAVGDPYRCDVVSLEAGGRVTRIDVKPERPASNLIWGCAVATVGPLQGLAHHAEPGFLFDEFARRRLVGALVLSDEYVDVGTPEALAAARARYG